jgi:mannose-6-phosphate isomerase-like protein (cupin superfamily)
MKGNEPRMARFARIFFPAALVLLSTGAHPQMTPSDHWSPAHLLEQARPLREQAAKADGSASITLQKYPHHYTMLAFRTKDGGGEFHQHFADLFYILDGHASLLTGGELVSPSTTAPGEIRSASVKGGTRQELHAGDVVHIPAATPHQMLVAPGETVTYFVVKIQESE